VVTQVVAVQIRPSVPDASFKKFAKVQKNLKTRKPKGLAGFLLSDIVPLKTRVSGKKCAFQCVVFL
jgi:hypothetical protein